jgi:hypothetical protein
MKTITVRALAAVDASGRWAVSGCSPGGPANDDDHRVFCVDATEPETRQFYWVTVDLLIPDGPTEPEIPATAEREDRRNAA